LLATWLRFHNLGGDSFWLDEIFTINTARLGFEGGLNSLHHPPIVYWLTTSFLSSLGESEFVARLSSAIAGILAVPMLAVLGKVSGQKSVGLWAAFLLTIAPFHIRYSQEARQYAWLMALSLTSYIFLYMAISNDRKRWWVYFALATVLNVYTHYGALLVLAAELLLILLWLTPKLLHHRWRSVYGPLLTGSIILLLYLPWFDRLQVAFSGSQSQPAIQGDGTAFGIVEWLQNAVIEFGFRGTLLPILATALFLMGLIILTRRRQWLILGIIISICVVPLAIIVAFQVGRPPYPKYIIYILPVFLLGIGVTIDLALTKVTNLLPKQSHLGYFFGAATIILAILALVWPGIRWEYSYVYKDWRSAVGRLDNLAQEDDIFVAMTLDLRDGFNQSFVVASFYLEHYFNQYTVLDGHSLDLESIQKLSHRTANVWVLILDRHPPIPMTDADISAEHFKGSIQLVYPNSESLSSLEALDLLYDKLVPLASSIAAQCLLNQGRAALNLSVNDYRSAEEALEVSIAQCPNLPVNKDQRPVLAQELLDYYHEGGQLMYANDLAQTVLMADRKNETALEIITVANLMQMFLEGQAKVSDRGLPIPVEVRRFTMPHNGDWGDVLLVHPPGSIAFNVDLPETTTDLIFRIALAPESRDWGGDGSTFVVTVESQSEPLRTIFRQHIGYDPLEYDWHDGRVSLADYAGQSITITLKTETGSAGDGTGDWAGWESPRIVLQP
jgi:hypothetical protein